VGVRRTINSPGRNAVSDGVVLDRFSKTSATRTLAIELPFVEDGPLRSGYTIHNRFAKAGRIVNVKFCTGTMNVLYKTDYIPDGLYGASPAKVPTVFVGIARPNTNERPTEEWETYKTPMAADGGDERARVYPFGAVAQMTIAAVSTYNLNRLHGKRFVIYEGPTDSSTDTGVTPHTFTFDSTVSTTTGHTVGIHGVTDKTVLMQRTLGAICDATIGAFQRGAIVDVGSLSTGYVYQTKPGASGNSVNHPDNIGWSEIDPADFYFLSGSPTYYGHFGQDGQVGLSVGRAPMSQQGTDISLNADQTEFAAGDSVFVRTFSGCSSDGTPGNPHRFVLRPNALKVLIEVEEYAA